MARIKVVMPQMGESITNGTITKWNKKVGDMVEIDEILLEISTDKVESEIPSPAKGRLASLLFPEGKTVDVGILIAEIEDDLAAKIENGSQTVTVATSSSPSSPAVQVLSKEAPSASSSGEDARFYTPLVKAMAKDANIPLNELSSIHGSGAGGRVNKRDLELYIQNRSAPNVERVSIPVKVASPTPSGSVATHAQGRVEVIPMDNMRKAIARNMVQSKLTSPHVNSLSEVDMTHLVKFRESFKSEFQKQEGFNLTYTPFIIRAMILALKDYPKVNASIDGDNIILKKDINIGVAVAVPGNGLIVPIIHQADNLNMLGLCRAINDLANRARNKKLTMENLEGGTFTFTNVGSFGTLMATPVILQPQVGIYASGVIQKRVVVLEDDMLAVRSMMYGTHTYDHRLVDGELGGKFLEGLHQHLRKMDPRQLF